MRPAPSMPPLETMFALAAPVKVERALVVAPVPDAAPARLVVGVVPFTMGKGAVELDVRTELVTGTGVGTMVEAEVDEATLLDPDPATNEKGGDCASRPVLPVVAETRLIW